MHFRYYSKTTSKLSTIYNLCSLEIIIKKLVFATIFGDNMNGKRKYAYLKTISSSNSQLSFIVKYFAISRKKCLRS